MATVDILESFKNINELIIAKKSILDHNGLKEIVESYSFLFISENWHINDEENKITQNISNSQLIVIDQNHEFNEIAKKQYLIVGFEKTLIILEKSLKTESYLSELLSNNSNIPICNLSNSKLSSIKNLEIPVDSIFIDEIQSFEKCFTELHEKCLISQLIAPCICGYLIKKSYLSKRMYRIEQFIYNRDLTEEEITKKDYIELRSICNGSCSICSLVYHFKRGELLVIKKNNSWKLADRELSNYREFSHPFMPAFYGISDDNIIIEFINGKTLKNIKKNEFIIPKYIQHHL
ncbi:hypothetical protein M9Y10_007928 [Tritrichomonas musculus]|uniref:Protein kinase domain-containing protein n=1 Tax=Tritrichomonas musculus TaxID=1915356 RepID=A0ABR2J322_9EUKA